MQCLRTVFTALAVLVTISLTVDDSVAADLPSRICGEDFQRLAAFRPATSFETQREALGIPRSLNDKPVLYVSAHRGSYNSVGPMRKRDSVPDMNQSGSSIKEDHKDFIDLSQANSEQVVQSIFDGFKYLGSPNVDANAIGAPGGDSVPLADYIVNVIVLPPLDSIGVSKEPSVTFGIFEANHKQMLIRLKELLLQKGYIKVQPQIGADSPRSLPEK